MRPLTCVVLAVAVCAAAERPSAANPIRLDQAGYLPAAPKLAAVVAAASPGEFVVKEIRSGKVVLKGELSAPVEDADSGDRVQSADFTKLNKPGTYYLEVPGAGRSVEFDVRSGVYDRTFYLAMRSYYGQRCGTAVDLGPGFAGYRYEACHTTGGWHPSSGKTGPQKSVKGWHDAGDYGRYVVNSGITTGTLLWAWEMFGSRVRNVSLSIPESRNTTPDMLDEIRWNLDWMLSMQDADGGVWHKQTTEKFSGFVMPEKDTMTSFVIGTGEEPWKSSCATADFAAVMAIAARAYKPFDSAYAGAALDASRNAWNWLGKHLDVLFRNPAEVRTGEYGDRNCSDERLWAAAELWRTTGDASFNAYFIANYEKLLDTIRPVGPPSWAAVAPLGLWAYALNGKGDKAAIDAIRRVSLSAADAIVERTRRHGYHMSMTTPDHIWGSNSVAANYGMQLLVANELGYDRSYVDAAMDNLHYLLGRNALSISWVTQVGANPFRHPHHRPSGADNNPEPWPGLLAGGPNARRQDPAMRTMPELPPAKMYLDQQESYATNEVAINWNAPLVFLLAGSMAHGGR